MRLLRTACMFGAMGAVIAATPAFAGTFFAMGSAMPAPAVVGQEVTISFPVQYLSHETSACGLQVNFGDGSAPLLDSVKQSTSPMSYSVKHTYMTSSASQPYGGRFIVTLTPSVHPGLGACLGNGATAMVAVNAPPVVLSKLSPQPGTLVTPANTAALVPKPPTIIAAFGAASVPINGSTALTFTITNPNASVLTGVGVSDTLPAGLVVSTPNGYEGSCGGGPLVASAGSTAIKLTGATLAGNASCTFSLNVTGTTGGEKHVTSGAVTSVESGAGGTATASVTVDTAVDMLHVLDATVFPYGVKQGFKLTGDTKGKICHFSVNVLLDGNQLFSKAIAAPLPWTSIDLQMPGGKNTNYVLALGSVNPVDGNYQGSNACKGSYSLPFAVVPETGTAANV